MTALQRVERAASALKVFPLPSAVLFPHTVLPLHIFEPRYRELVKAALAGDRVMAMAQLEPGYEGSYAGRPRMRPMICAGVIAWHEELDGGRYNIIVQGTVRARILEELPPEQPYREVRAAILPDSRVPRRRRRSSSARRCSSSRPGCPRRWRRVCCRPRPERPGGALADVVASSVVADVERRQDLLCELDVQTRLRSVLAEVSEVLARLAPARPDGPVN